MLNIAAYDCFIWAIGLFYLILYQLPFDRSGLFLALLRYGNTVFCRITGLRGCKSGKKLAASGSEFGCAAFRERLDIERPAGVSSRRLK